MTSDLSGNMTQDILSPEVLLFFLKKEVEIATINTNGISVVVEWQYTTHGSQIL